MFDSALATGDVSPVPRAATRTHAIWAPKKRMENKRIGYNRKENIIMEEQNKVNEKTEQTRR